jgi:hypothetical protein
MEFVRTFFGELKENAGRKKEICDSYKSIKVEEHNLVNPNTIKILK